MFGLFNTSCPLELGQKTWTERRMLWLAEQLGAHRLHNATVVTPTDEFFPDRYDADYPSARKCLDRMCGYMGVDSGAVELEIASADAMPGAAGLYHMRAQGHIFVADTQLADPTRLLATLAHELAHEILLRGGHLTGQEPDHEQVTDLLPVFLGAGIFGANATIREYQERAGAAWSWGFSTQGYLSSIVLGYALALFAYVRGEDAPDWRHHLRTDAKKTLSAGLRFLQKTGDSLFTPKTVHRPPAPSAALALEQLAARSPTLRLAALWDVIDHRLGDPHLLGPVLRCASESDATIRAAATQALGVFGDTARGALPQLIDLLHDRVPFVRTAAAAALGELKPPANEVVPELARLLLQEDTAAGAVVVLNGYGAEAAPCLPKLLVALERSLSTFTDATPHFFALFRTLCPDPERTLRAHFGARDPDLLRQALTELKRRD